MSDEANRARTELEQYRVMQRTIDNMKEWIPGRQVGDAYEDGYHMGHECHFDTCRNRRMK